LRFEAARRCIIERTSEQRRPPRIERVPVECASGRVLAENVHADRAYPPFDRSIRDGFAIKSENFGGRARVIGEVRAGEVFQGVVSDGEAVEIMTGAPLPDGTDAVIMIEHIAREGDSIFTSRKVKRGDFVAARGSDRSAGELVLADGHRLDFAGAGVLATVGVTQVAVYEQPRVAIVSTGDEIVSIDKVPADYQIRNSNSYSLAAQVTRAGGRPFIAAIARDNYESTHSIIRSALESDLLLISGGVSAGKYDIVEKVLGELGAEFYFDHALIQPGQPVVFGRVDDTFFFGLPGNPASTMVTFEIFARAGLELLGGCAAASLRVAYARLTQELKQKPGLTRFLPAILADGAAEVTPVRYTGSGDVFGLGVANCFLIARDDREAWSRGDLIEVLLR
jgi:molybdopterin molybdotransferase